MEAITIGYEDQLGTVTKRFKTGQLISEKDAVNLDYEAQLKGQSLRDLKLHGLLNAIHLANEDQLQGQSLGDLKLVS